MLAELHLEVTLVSVRTWIRSGKCTIGFKQVTVLRSGASIVTPVQPFATLDPVFGARMYQYNIRILFESIAVSVAGSFPQCDEGTDTS
jgi:hypothetical protein